MIDVIAQTPIEYSRQSRDYQVLARLYTALYNFSKLYIDDMSVWDNNIDNKLSTLRSKTLNFHPKHAWEDEALDAAVSCIKHWIRLKGTRKAIEEVLEILIRVNNLVGKPIVEIDYTSYTMLIKIPKQLASMGCVEDLLELIIPIGMGWRIIEYISITEGFDNDKYELIDYIGKDNRYFIPVYKMGIGGPLIEYSVEDIPSYTNVRSDVPSLHVAPGEINVPGVIGEIISTSNSVWPAKNNKSQGTTVHYNIVTTMQEVDNSYNEDSEGNDGE